MHASIRLLAVAIAAAAGMASSGGQNSSIESGREVYMRECAACHGVSATGLGVASWVLKERTPDLTRLSDFTRPFPRDSVRRVITGQIRLAPGHGRSEMPAWPESLTTAATGGTTDLDALLNYLEEIQLRKFGPYQGPTPQVLASAGAPIYKSQCAGCHGEDGRGHRPDGYFVGVTPPDLTTFASRRSAPLDLAALYEYIARCDDRDQGVMPEWERALQHAGWGEYLTIVNIESLAAFVASIQKP